MRISGWSADVCSSDLQRGGILVAEHAEDPALVVELVVVARSLAIPRPIASEGGCRRIGGDHCLGSPGAGSSDIRPSMAFSISSRMPSLYAGCSSSASALRSGETSCQIGRAHV